MSWLNNMVLKTKLILLTTVMVIGIVFLAFQGFRGAAGWQDDVTRIGKEASVRQAEVLRMDRERLRVRSQTLSVFEHENSSNAQQKFSDVLTQREKAFADFDKSMKGFEGVIRSDKDRALFNDFTQKYKSWKSEYASIDEIIRKLSKNSDSNMQKELFTEYKSKVTAMIPVSDSMSDALTALRVSQRERIAEIISSAEEGATSFKTLITIVSIITLVVSILLAFLIITSVTKSITTAVETINEGALQISDASDQVASSSTSLAQGASEQASSVEEVSATLEEASAAVASNTENARQADILAKQANISAKEGQSRGVELVQSMKEVNESASKIANIVKAIDQIAFQVNLLALNAAVEAARAGEHGLGFAVVADEVRNLAQRAANSAKETGVVIEEAVTQIKKGSNIAELASASFSDIEEKSKKVSDLIGEVALSSREQAEAVGQLNMAMAQIDQVTQQVAANSEEAAAASEELNAQAAAALEAIAGLAKVVGLDMSGKRATRSASKPTHKPGIITTSKPKQLTKMASNQPKKTSNDDVFPLSESDLKEF